MHSAAAAAVGGVTVTSQLTVFSNHKLATRRMVRTLSDLSLVFCYLVCGHHGFQSGVVLLQWQMVYLLHQLGLHTLHMRGATQCHTGNSLLLHSAKSTLSVLGGEIVLVSSYIRICMCYRSLISLLGIHLSVFEF